MIKNIINLCTIELVDSILKWIIFGR
jgi:hypothetical protein